MSPWVFLGISLTSFLLGVLAFRGMLHGALVRGTCVTCMHDPARRPDGQRFDFKRSMGCIRICTPCLKVIEADVKWAREQEQ